MSTTGCQLFLCHTPLATLFHVLHHHLPYKHNHIPLPQLRAQLAQRLLLPPLQRAHVRLHRLFVLPNHVRNPRLPTAAVAIRWRVTFRQEAMKKSLASREPIRQPSSNWGSPVMGYKQAGASPPRTVRLIEHSPSAFSVALRLSSASSVVSLFGLRMPGRLPLSPTPACVPVYSSPPAALPLSSHQPDLYIYSTVHSQYLARRLLGLLKPK